MSASESMRSSSPASHSQKRLASSLPTAWNNCDRTARRRRWVRVHVYRRAHCTKSRSTYNVHVLYEHIHKLHTYNIMCMYKYIRVYTSASAICILVNCHRSVWVLKIMAMPEDKHTCNCRFKIIYMTIHADDACRRIGVHSHIHVRTCTSTDMYTNDELKFIHVQAPHSAGRVSTRDGTNLYQAVRPHSEVHSQWANLGQRQRQAAVNAWTNS